MVDVDAAGSSVAAMSFGNTKDSSQEQDHEHHHHRLSSTTGNEKSCTTTNAARRRSQSDATAAQPSVETVVSKAKRAASILWTLLHAQNCVVSADDCPHAGCREAKLLHLHLKTCSAGSGFGCPTQYHGCAEARQLLAHYKRCRSIRARQVGGGGAHLQPAPAAASRPQQQHVCLVCSLVARQARSMLEKTNNRNASTTGSPGSYSSCSSSSSSSVASSSSTSLRKPGSRKSNHVVSSYVLPSAVDIMPPPPARSAQAAMQKVVVNNNDSSNHAAVGLERRLLGRERSVSWGDASPLSSSSSRTCVQLQEVQQRTTMGRARSASVGGPIVAHQHSASSTPICYDCIPEEEGYVCGGEDVVGGGGGEVEECPEDKSALAAVDGGGEFDLTTTRSTLNGSG